MCEKLFNDYSFMYIFDNSLNIIIAYYIEIWRRDRKLLDIIRYKLLGILESD